MLNTALLSDRYMKWLWVVIMMISSTWIHSSVLASDDYQLKVSSIGIEYKTDGTVRAEMEVGVSSEWAIKQKENGGFTIRPSNFQITELKSEGIDQEHVFAKRPKLYREQEDLFEEHSELLEKLLIHIHPDGQLILELDEINVKADTWKELTHSFNASDEKEFQIALYYIMFTNVQQLPWIVFTGEEKPGEKINILGREKRSDGAIGNLDDLAYLHFMRKREGRGLFTAMTTEVEDWLRLINHAEIEIDMGKGKILWMYERKLSLSFYNSNSPSHENEKNAFNKGEEISEPPISFLEIISELKPL